QNVLEKEEKIAERLSRARRALGGFTTMAQFVPSIARQKENRELVRTRLMAPHLAAYLARTGYRAEIDQAATRRFLEPEELPRTGPLSLLSILDVAGRDHRAHIVLLQKLTNPT